MIERKANLTMKEKLILPSKCFPRSWSYCFLTKSRSLCTLFIASHERNNLAIEWNSKIFICIGLCFPEDRVTALRRDCGTCPVRTWSLKHGSLCSWLVSVFDCIMTWISPFVSAKMLIPDETIRYPYWGFGLGTYSPI